MHRNLGPGLLESIYEKALCREMEISNVKFENQVTIPILYKGEMLGEHRVDMLV